MYVTQISVFIQNRPGTAAEVFEILSRVGVNIRALSLSDAGDFGLMRMIVDDTEAAEKALRAESIMLSLTQVLAVRMGDTPGSLLRIMTLLGDNGLNVEYAYAFIGREKNAATVIIRVEDKDGAAPALLRENGFTLLEQRDCLSE